MAEEKSRSRIIVPYSEITGIHFYCLGDEENKIDSHVNVLFQESSRGNLPMPGGVSDDHMGSYAHEWDCGTCKYDKKLCPGHFGSVQLKYPILSPMFIKEILKWLKVICFNCGKLLINYEKLPVREDKILKTYVELSTRSANKNINCVHCNSIHPHVVKDKSDPISIFMEFYNEKAITKTPVLKSPLYPHFIKNIFNKISDETVLMMGKPLVSHPKKFVLSIIKAPPNPIRPEIKKITGGISTSNDLTVLLQAIMKINDDMPNIIPNQIDQELQIKIHNLNLATYELIRGSGSMSKRSIVNNSRKPLTSISSKWPKKFGRIRRNLMGRRANHMCRSFISCDTFLKIDEVGMPIAIAKNIQFPEIVQEYNFNQCLIYFMNGIKRYPGCTKIKKANNGKTYFVDKVEKLEIGDIIHRDVIDGDIIGFNRQPSLEPSSLSSMKVVIMHEGDTLRINVLACSLFNADFDGDAMNGLFVLSGRVMNEINELSSPKQFFISYKDANPKIGAAQDSLIGAAEFTRTNVRIDKYHAMQMFTQVKIYHDFSQYPNDKIFNGRELISIMLKETGNLINYTGIASFYKENQAEFRKYRKEDIKVEIDRGDLKTGILDKASIGEGSSGSIFHIIHNQYGANAALEAVFNMQQMVLSFLYNRGLTVSVRDLLLSPEALDEIHKIEETLIAESKQITQRLNTGKIITPIGKTITEYSEELQMNALNPGDEYWKHILRSIDPDNNDLYKMIMHGSKGKAQNFDQISSAIGQQEINGSRMAENFNGRTFAYFTRNDNHPSSRGFVANSFISGCALYEFIFGAQTARYALINKALSTSITGTYNRMAIKNLESLIVDNFRRAINGTKIVQLLVGDTGTDPRFIEKVKFPTMKKELSDEIFEKEFHSQNTMFDKEYQNKETQKQLDQEFDLLKKDREFYRHLFLTLESSSGKMYSDSAIMQVNVNRIIEDVLYNLELKKFKNTKNINPIKTIEKVKKLCDNLVYCLVNEIQEKKLALVPEYLTKSTTLMQILIRSYLNTSLLLKKNINDTALDIVIDHIKISFSKSLIDYGKVIGIIAAQSISEPMTQQILDSHHGAGMSSTKKKGMFRIKEILSARSTIKMKAPSMVLNIKNEYRKDQNKVQEIANHIEMLSLKRFVNNWQVFFEKYGNPIHPQYKHEVEMIKEFEKYNQHVKAPSDLTNWCIRFNLDKAKLIEKQMKMETIYFKIRKEFPATHIVYTTDNADNIIMRIYLRNSISKKSEIKLDQIVELTQSLLSVIIRGIKGVKAAYVKKINKTELQKDGSLSSDPSYYIFTDGTNMEAILENPYIDHQTSQSDSILEMSELFGITAGRQKIVNELKTQISGPSYYFYDIYADTMVYPGYITGIDRYGSSKRDSSFMLRISDSSPIEVIVQAAVDGLSDNLSGVSGSLMLGKEPMIGDLYNTFILDEKFVRSKIKSVDTLLNEL